MSVDDPLAPRPEPLLRALDAVVVAVPDLAAGVAFYAGLGHELVWRNDEIGQAGLSCPDTGTEIVLSTTMRAEPNWLVRDAAEAANSIQAAGGRVIEPVRDIPVGHAVVVEDPFGNRLVLVDLSKGVYRTDSTKSVTGVMPHAPGTRRR